MIYLFLLLLPFNNFELSKNSFLSAMRMQFVIVLSSLTKFDLSLYEIFLDSSRNYKRHRLFFLSRISFELKNIFRTKIHGQVRREEFPRIVEARLEKYPIYTHALSRN